MNDDVVGETLCPVDGEDSRQPMDVHIASPIPEEVHGDLASWSGDAREGPQEGFRQGPPLKVMPPEKIHGHVVKPLPTLRGIPEGVADDDPQVRHR